MKYKSQKVAYWFWGIINATTRYTINLWIYHGFCPFRL